MVVLHLAGRGLPDVHDRAQTAMRLGDLVAVTHRAPPPPAAPTAARAATPPAAGAPAAASPTPPPQRPSLSRSPARAVQAHGHLRFRGTMHPGTDATARAVKGRPQPPADTSTSPCCGAHRPTLSRRVLQRDVAPTCTPPTGRTVAVRLDQHPNPQSTQTARGNILRAAHQLPDTPRGPVAQRVSRAQHPRVQLAHHKPPSTRHRRPPPLRPASRSPRANSNRHAAGEPTPPTTRGSSDRKSTRLNYSHLGI